MQEPLPDFPHDRFVPPGSDLASAPYFREVLAAALGDEGCNVRMRIPHRGRWNGLNQTGQLVLKVVQGVA